MSKSTKPSLKKVAGIKDMATSRFSVSIRFRTEDGTVSELELARSDANDLRLLERELLDAGAVLPPKVARKKYLASFAELKPPRQLTRVARSGWLKGNRSFALQTDIIGKDKSLFLGLPMPDQSNRKGWVDTAGTTATWKTSVAPLATLSSRFVLSTSAAFAAPLLDLCKQSSFSICLSGQTRLGKSVATLFGASVIGLGDQQQLPTWHATDAGQEELLPRFNDCLAPIDDFESLKGTNAQKYQRVRDFAYGVSAGAEKRRHSSFKAVSTEWRSIVITSMEKSIDELAKSAGEQRQGGETIRMLNVPILEEGRSDIFDLAAAQNIKVTAEWKAERLKEIVRSCSEHHGAVFVRYLAILCSEPDKVRARAEKYIAKFVAEVGSLEDGDKARDIASRFGLLFAGGKLAIHYKLVNWKQSELSAAMTTCYRAARDSVPDEGVVFRNGVILLEKSLASLIPKSEFLPDKPPRGYRVTKKDRYLYMIKTDEFNKVFETGEQRDLVLQSLIRMKRIATAKPRGKQKSVGPKEQFKWPDGKRVRSYRITMPRDD